MKKEKKHIHIEEKTAKIFILKAGIIGRLQEVKLLKIIKKEENF